jgi:hypothetical protein
VFSLQDPGPKVNDHAVLGHVADLDGIAANLAVLDVGLVVTDISNTIEISSQQ